MRWRPFYRRNLQLCLSPWLPEPENNRNMALKYLRPRNSGLFLAMIALNLKRKIYKRSLLNQNERVMSLLSTNLVPRGSVKSLPSHLGRVLTLLSYKLKKVRFEPPTLMNRKSHTSKGLPKEPPISDQTHQCLLSMSLKIKVFLIGYSKEWDLAKFQSLLSDEQQKKTQLEKEVERLQSFVQESDWCRDTRALPEQSLFLKGR